MNNKIVSGLLTASIIVSVATPIFATSKEENIYTNLDNNGNIEDIYVVNTFLLDEDSKIIDYGDYTNLRNLSGSEEIEINDTMVTVNGKKGKNYYQGKLQTNNIPWTINVKYYLNGEEISCNDLAGKSGELEIGISVKQNKNVNETFFKNYLLQVNLSLDTEKCKNIQADGATLANVGSKKQLTYNILAGSEKEISIKSDVTNFELKDGISFNGVLMSMAIDNFDTSVINDKVSLLKTGVEKLNTGANKLKTGSEKYKSGISEFANKVKDLPVGSSQIQSGINQALEGVKTIENKIASVIEGENSSSSNSQIQASIKSSAEQEAKKEIQNVVTDELTKLAQSAWYQELDQNTQLQIANSIKETATGVATPIANNVALITANTVSNVYETTFKSSMSQLSSGLKELETGLKTLSTEYSKMDKGLNQISSSASTFSSSYNEIDSGILELSNGINTLHDKTKNLDGEVNEKIDEILAKYKNSDYKPVSFTSSKNQEVEAVQFVIKTEGISIKEEKEEVVEQKENLSFWQKVGNLFKK